MNTEAMQQLLAAAKAMLETLDGEFCGGCPHSLLQPWEDLERAVLMAEYAEPSLHQLMPEDLKEAHDSDLGITDYFVEPAAKKEPPSLWSFFKEVMW